MTKPDSPHKKVFSVHGENKKKKDKNDNNTRSVYTATARVSEGQVQQLTGLGFIIGMNGCWLFGYASRQFSFHFILVGLLSVRFVKALVYPLLPRTASLSQATHTLEQLFFCLRPLQVGDAPGMAGWP